MELSALNQNLKYFFFFCSVREGSLNSHVFKYVPAVENRVLLSVLQLQDFIVTEKKDEVNKSMV